MNTDDQKQLLDVVRRHIPDEWRSDIKVETAGALAQANGYPAQTGFVIISARSKLARMQAMLSLGRYALNDPGAWLRDWKRRDHDGRFEFCVYGPSKDVVQAELLDSPAPAS